MSKCNLLNEVEAEQFVKEKLFPQESRLKHVLEIAHQVRNSANQIKKVKDISVPISVCGALLHDIGYAEDIKESGFHPIDGHKFLIKEGYSELAAIIAGHSCSPEEAKLMGLMEIIPSEKIEAKLITYWDMQVKQGGQIITYEERLEDIIQRYGANSLIGRANLLAQPRILKIFAEIDGLLKYD